MFAYHWFDFFVSIHCLIWQIFSSYYGDGESESVNHSVVSDSLTPHGL